jgi:hypothetical protein
LDDAWWRGVRSNFDIHILTHSSESNENEQLQKKELIARKKGLGKEKITKSTNHSTNVSNHSPSHSYERHIPQSDIVTRLNAQ